MEKDLLELNSIKRDLSGKLVIMYGLTKYLGNVLRSYARMEKNGKKLELLNLACERMEDNFIDMQNIYMELSNFISKISCEK